VPLTKQNVLKKLRDALKNMPSGLEGKFVKPLVVISVCEQNSHFWSPELSLDIEEKENGTEIRCTLGPRSSLWTMFATFYGFSILVGMAARSCFNSTPCLSIQYSFNGTKAVL